MDEEEYFQLSALQHYRFCKRQCFLIHKENIWIENSFTIAGDIMHEHVDRQGATTVASGVRHVRALDLRSDRLGVVGRADLVEFDSNINCVFPVEYKLGKPKSSDIDIVQLCAQAIALEEMMDCQISEGAIYYGKTKHRLPVSLNEDVRHVTFQLAKDIHALLKQDCAPPPLNSSVCNTCSLIDFCLPKVSVAPGKAQRYLDQVLEEFCE